MDWFTRLIVVLSFTSASYAYADDPYSKLADACLQDKNIYFCQQAAAFRDNTERSINQQLIDWGLFNSAVIVGSILKTAADRKFQIVDRPTTTGVFSMEKRFVFTPNEISVTLIWPFE